MLANMLGGAPELEQERYLRSSTSWGTRRRRWPSNPNPSPNPHPHPHPNPNPNPNPKPNPNLAQVASRLTHLMQRCCSRLPYTSPSL